MIRGDSATMGISDFAQGQLGEARYRVRMEIARLGLPCLFFQLASKTIFLKGVGATVVVL